MKLTHQGLAREYLTCLESVLITILKARGPVDEAKLLAQPAFFVLAGGTYRIRERMQAFAQWPGVTTQTQQATTEDALRQGILEQLAEGHPVCVPLDLHPWAHTPHTGTQHQVHYVAIFNMEGDQCDVVCPYYNFEGTVSFREVSNAYFSLGKDQPGLMTFALNPNQETVDIKTLLETSAAYMLGSQRPPQYQDTEPELMGCAGIRTLATRLSSLVETEGDALSQNPEMVNLTRYLQNVGYARHWLGEYVLHHNDSLLDDAQHEAIVTRFRKLEQAWMGTGKRLAMGLHGKRTAMVVKSLGRLNELAQMEEDLFTDITEALQGKGMAQTDHGFEETYERPTYQAPQTDAENQIAAAFAEILQVQKVGRDDNFFLLGGDSVLVVRLIAKIRGTFAVEMSLRKIFETPTVAELATSIRDDAHEKTAAIVPTPREGTVPFTAYQKCLLLLDRANKGGFTPVNVPSIIRLKGAFDRERLMQAFNLLVARHEILRLRVDETNEGYVQRFPAELTFDPPITDLSHLSEEDQETELERIHQESCLAFDLEREAMVKMRLFRFGPDHHILALNFHHTVVDGWAVGLIFREVSILYRSLVTGNPANLPAQNVQYVDYSFWHQKRLKQPAIKTKLAYWRKKLAGMKLALDLPYRQPLPLVADHKAQRVFFGTDTALTQALEALANREGVTLFALALAALKVLLHNHSSSRDITVGTSFANRGHANVSEMVGVFSNLHPLRTQFNGRPSFKEIIADVAITATEAYDNQELPPMLLMDESVEDNNEVEEIYPVIFKFQNTVPPVLDLEGLDVSFVRATQAAFCNSLVLTLWTTYGNLEGYLGFRCDLFEPEVVIGMTEDYKQLLAQMVADTSQCPLH